MEALVLDVGASVGPGTPDEVRGLLGRHRAVVGHPGLSDGRLRALDLAALRSGAGLVAAVEARRRDDGLLVGWAQIDDGGGGRPPTLEVVALSGAGSGSDDGPLAERLADAALAAVDDRAGPPRPLRWWVSHATAVDDARASARRFHAERDLLQLRGTLPLPVREVRPGRAPVTTRAFRVGQDEEGWLRQNNRAFADHPEQGGWDLATLDEREGEAWFDPDGFRVLEVDGRIAGSCWTKVHAGPPPLGEIYVIGVDPDFHGRGWGRALTEAGFAWLHGAGLTVGMLYVDAANGTAVGLYRSMGLTTHHVDRAYLRAP